MALSSASLFSAPYQIAQDAFNTIRNAVALGQANHNAYALFPSFNPHLIHTAYRYIENGPDMSLEFIAYQSGFRFFLYKTDNQVYEVVSNEQVTEIYKVSQVN